MSLNSDCLDLELLQGYLDSMGKVIVGKMFLLYCQQSEIYLKDIEQAQLDDVSVDWQSHCHKMKGAAASVGMLELHAKLKLVEKVEATKEEKLVILNELQDLNSKASATFKEWLNTD